MRGSCEGAWGYLELRGWVKEPNVGGPEGAAEMGAGGGELHGEETWSEQGPERGRDKEMRS